MNQFGDWLDIKSGMVVVDSGLDPLEISIHKEKGVFWQNQEYDGKFFYSKGWYHRYFTKARLKRIRAVSLNVFLKRT